MCGIVGVLSKEINKGIVKKATKLLEHRGPDDFGFFFDKNIALGHRRLSIIDLSRKAGQPMTNESEDLQIIFNGEIYNFQELRQELEKKHEFKSNSDTEVILHAYEEWGEDCTKKFNGMFAFAIWDTKKKELFLARDRVGEKPLYYYADKKKFIFASEIKALLEFISPMLNKKLLYDYFNYFILIGEETLFENIFSLPAAHHFNIKLDKEIKIKKERYWDIYYNLEKGPDSSFISELRKQIYESIEKRQISDVPIGAFISGGIDSSAIVAFMQKFDKVKTFCVGSGDETELENARYIAEVFNTDHHEILINAEDFAKNLKKMIWHYDMPISFASSIPLYFVAKMTKGKATVVLTGEGADELFAGYNRYYLMTRARKINSYLKIFPESIKNTSLSLLNKIFSDPRYRKNLEIMFKEFNYDYATGINIFIGKERDLILKNIEKNEFFKKKVLDILREKKTSFLNKILYLDLKTYLVELLMKQDKMSMAASIESRVPFLDPKIIKFSSSLPEYLKLRKKQGKYILKRAMHGILPKKVIYQKKIGFPVPIDSWFRKELRGFVSDTLLKDNEIIKDLFNIGYIKKLIEKQKTSNCSAQLWALMNFKLWHDSFINK